MNRKLCRLPMGILFLVLGISSLIYTPMDFFFYLRLLMTPGTPAYEFWANPPDTNIVKISCFNITNSERFLNGSDADLHLEEVGPFIFREKFTHSNIVFNENSTLTYTVTRKLIYFPERNTIDINSTIIAPNIAVLSMVSYFHDAPFFLRASLNMILNKYNSQPLRKISVYDYLLNQTDPASDFGKALTGGRFVPSGNTGFVSQINLKKPNNLTVFIGPKYKHDQFFYINNCNGYEWIPNYKRCLPKFDNVSDFTLFPQFLKKEQILRGWASLLCKFVELRFSNETSRYGMASNKYDAQWTMFDRTEPSYLDCYRDNPPLPNGVSDISPCYFGFPVVASFPHFLNSDPMVTSRLKGLNPNKQNHSSFVVLEKFSGVPLNAREIFQVSVHVRKLRGFNERFQRFSDMYIPDAIISYEMEGLPWYIYSVMYVGAVIIPNTQFILSLVYLATGIIYLYLLYSEFWKKLSKKTIEVASIEREKFLNKK